MSKAKSVVITVLLALAVAVAAFFAAISFPVANNVKRLNSIASNIHLGARYSGYAYTTVYPEGVITAEEYGILDDENKAEAYEKVGSLYVEKEEHSDIEQLKADVAADALILNKRFGQKGYSSYSVAVEDGLSIKISVPTNFTAAAYKNNDESSRSSSLSTASAALSSITAYGELTLRTSDESIQLTDADGNTTTYDSTKKGKDKWVSKAKVTDSNNNTVNSYSLTDGDDAAEYFKSVTSRTVGSSAVITFNFTKEGREKFKELTTRAVSSSSQTVYFFVGDRQLVSFSCTEVVDRSSLTLQANDGGTAQNAAIAMNSAVNGQALTLNYQDVSSVMTSTATGGENAALLLFIASILVLLGLVVLLVVKYNYLGTVVSLISVAFALIIVYALCLLNIQVTFAVVLTAMLCLALFVISNAIVFAEVKRLTEGGRTIQASIKEAYKNVIMTVSDMHIVLVIVAILLATVAAGEVAACGLIAVIGVVVSYVLYWFTRFMWYVISSPVKDKFKFAGLKRVVYEDD
ncbi:MAG: hypothetical protein K2G26_04025 [Clostridia bacterium]|nr:hypothetical protein [Clostridia bacterium]